MARNLVFGVLVAAAVMGCATSSQKSPADSRAAQNSLQTASAAVDRHCAHDTGTRIKQPPDKCVTQPSRTYTQKELEDTGRIDVADALRQLDPSIQ